MPLTISQLQSLTMELAQEKGFGVKPEEINVGEKIALIHSEASEALQAYRDKNMDGKDGFQEELADTVIRILHLAGIFNIDLEAEILKKMEFNKTRSWSSS
ncbi:MAG: hypothetical protein WC477_07035 [Patescibacteria group bacterium]